MRLLLKAPQIDPIKAMSDDSSEAYSFLVRVCIEAVENGMGCMGENVDILYSFDRVELYGNDILIFYNKVCNSDDNLLFAIIKAIQYGCKNDLNIQILRCYLNEYGFDYQMANIIKDRIIEFLPKLQVSSSD